jgi:hypothetical protein
MTQDNPSLPRRGAGGQIESRPLHVEEWLDSLPYVDFQKTSRLLEEATRETNAIALKPANRLELVELYNRPYQYYLNTQIKTGAQHTLQSIETTQEQTEPLKRIAVNLGYACRLAAEEALRQKTLWRQSKPPLPALLSSLSYLSHALIFSFLEYAPTPKNAWREIHFTYSVAEGMGKEHASLVPVGGNAKKDATTIANAYRRIALASLADPHHLPFGAIWEIYELLGHWAHHIEIGPFRRANRHGGIFVVNLDGDERPVPFARFDSDRGAQQHRLIDASAMGGLIEEQLDRVQSGQGLDEHVTLSPYFARAVLVHMARSWSLPAKRQAPRTPGDRPLSLVCGLSAAYFFVNGRQEFVPDPVEDADGLMEDESGSRAAAPNYGVDQWNLVDEGPGGFAVIRTDRPGYNVRVGDLVALCGESGTGTVKEDWAIGIIRWMMVRQGKAYRLGVQILPGSVRAARVRAVSGSSYDRSSRRALLLQEQGQAGARIIAERGLHREGRELELIADGKTVPVRAADPVEATVGFEYFAVSPAA